MKKEYQQSTELEGQDAVMALRLGLTSRSRASADEGKTASNKSHATALRLRFASSSVQRPGPRVEEKREKESMQKGEDVGHQAVTCVTRGMWRHTIRWKRLRSRISVEHNMDKVLSRTGE